jgi:hypothetical protein
MAPKLRSKSLSSRSYRAKSLPGGLDSALSPTKSPRKLTPFSLGPIIPSSVSICKACKTPILKSPTPPSTPKLTRPARNLLEAQLQSSLLQAHGRAVNIQAAYASASREYNNLGNADRTGVKEDLLESKIHESWRHAPYTEEACKVVGTLYGELGRALATSQKTVNMLDSLLDAERLRLQVGDNEEQKRLRRDWENKWFAAQHAARIQANLPKKRKRNKKS